MVQKLPGIVTIVSTFLTIVVTAIKFFFNKISYNITLEGRGYFWGFNVLAQYALYHIQ